MKEKLAKLLENNGRVYMEVGRTICLYTKQMLDKNEFMFCANEYEDIHALVQDLRQYYLVNYIKDEEGRLIVRNFKKNRRK
jgi:hypothetical protein